MRKSPGSPGLDTEVPALREDGADQHRILVVEDETLLALHLSSMLEDLNYGVCGMAASGADALDIAARERPALALKGRLRRRVAGDAPVGPAPLGSGGVELPSP